MPLYDIGINGLTETTTLSSGDMLALYAASNGDSRKASINTLTNYLEGTLSVSDSKIIQYAAPSSTGFSVSINNANYSVWLVLTPNSGYSAGTLVLPAVANCIEKQEILVNTTQFVTTLTIDGNGATVVGGPSTLAANAYFTLKFEPVLKRWYRVG